MSNFITYRKIFILIDYIENHQHIPYRGCWEYDLNLANDEYLKTIQRACCIHITGLQKLLTKHVINSKGKVRFLFKLLFLIKKKGIIIGPNYYGIDSGCYTLPTTKGMIDFRISDKE